jgi:transcription elongation factor GreB
VRFLRGRLDGLVVVSEPPADRTRVFFGAWVTVEDDAGDIRRHRIVGPDEFDREPGYISMDSPLGRALLGRRTGDTVDIKLPAGVKQWTVTAIEYR